MCIVHMVCYIHVHADCNVSFSMVQTTSTIAVPLGNPFGPSDILTSTVDHIQRKEFVQFIEGKSNTCLVKDLRKLCCPPKTLHENGVCLLVVSVIRESLSRT